MGLFVSISQEGQTKIRIRHLPDSIDTESVRVTGLGDAQLFDVVGSVGSCIDEIDTTSTAEAIRKLNARKDVLVKDVFAINAIGQTMMKYSESLAGDSVSPRQAERFFENLLSRSRDMTSSNADLQEEILQLSRQIDALSSAEKKKEGKTDGEVSVVIMTKQPTDIQLKLTYRKSLSIPGVDSPDFAALYQSFEVRYGLRHTNYTPPQKQGYLHHQYPCITVHGLRKAQAKIGQT